MESKAAIIVSCWLAVAIMSVAYMWIFADRVGDVLFGIFLPVGLLVLVAIIVTFGLMSISGPEKKSEAK
jgi:hypothetical protein